MEFLNHQIRDSKTLGLNVQAAFNTPCYALNFMRKDNPEVQEQIVAIYKEFINNEQQNQEILKLLASSIHEIVGLIPYESGSLG